jgi:hypothetical protein
MIMLEAPKASPPSPTLEGDTAVETFLLKQRRWLATGAAALTHLHPFFFISRSSNCSQEAVAGLCWPLLNMAHNIRVVVTQEHPQGIFCSGLGGSGRLRGQLLFGFGRQQGPWMHFASLQAQEIEYLHQLKAASNA